MLFFIVLCLPPFFKADRPRIPFRPGRNGWLTDCPAALVAAQAVVVCLDAAADAPPFSREIVAARLGALAPAFWLWLASLAAAGASGCANKDRSRPRGRTGRERGGQRTASCAAPVCRSRRGLRWAVGLTAAALIALGAVNGGARDVLVKAINICTECIGLG